MLAAKFRGLIFRGRKCQKWQLSQYGAARGTRTPDPVITNDVLYQLSYCGGPDLFSAFGCGADNART